MQSLTDNLLENYDYYADEILQNVLHEQDRRDIRTMLKFGRMENKFGLRMTAHQNRVARDGAAFLRFLGHSPRAAANFRAAMLFHDIGKAAPYYTALDWTLEERPSPEEKARQRKHARIGADMFEKTAVAIKDHAHYAVRYALTRYHHERADKTGPERISLLTLPVFVQVSCIVDAYDGDRIWRPHQPRRRTPLETIERMLNPSGKYEGAFDRALLEKYAEMKKSS